MQMRILQQLTGRAATPLCLLWVLPGSWSGLVGLNGFVTTEATKELWLLSSEKRKNQDPLLSGAGSP